MVLTLTNRKVRRGSKGEGNLTQKQSNTGSGLQENSEETRKVNY